MKKAIPILLVVLSAIVIYWYIFLRDDTISYGPGVLAPDSPIQEIIDSPESFYFKDYTITPLATFDIKAKVLSKKDYNSGREAELSPVDLALGWGRMSDESVLDSIDISQSVRWYRWRSNNMSIPREEIESHSSNMHIIPANQSVETMLERVRKGDIVEFSGNLIRVEAEDNWYWVSSLSRTDTGDGACELVWVETFTILQF